MEKKSFQTPEVYHQPIENKEQDDKQNETLEAKAIFLRF